MKKFLLFTILAFSFGVTAQTITSVSPNSGSSGQNLQVTITGNGTDFSTISGTQGVYFNGGAAQQYQNFVANSYQFISNTEIIADVTVPYFMPTGPYDIYVSSDFGAYLTDGFSVTNNANTISGNIGFDTNGNGCDASDIHMAGIAVNMDDGTTISTTFTNALGNYTFYVPAGNFTITPQPEMPYFTTSPLSATINFATQNNLSQTQDFCLLPNGVHNDVNISILPYGPARPGFDATYQLVYKNTGNQTLTGSINFTYDDSRLDFISANPAAASQTSGNLNWNYVNLLPFETRVIYVVLNVNSPMETPAVNIGDILNYTATVNPVSGDDTPDNNFANINQTVVGSIDPNDKAVAEGSEVNITNVGNYLHYLIRFQNSGTYFAENVVVKDMLSSNLDLSTLEVLSTSHPYRTTLTEGNKLEFFFENINLPAEIDDEPGSHGFISYKIKPSSSVGIGSVIENTAEIFFDFNFPIITNTVSTTFTVLSNNSFDFDNAIVLYPNPAGNILNIKFQSSTETASVTIFNQLGQIVKTVSNTNTSLDIAIGDLNTGTYYVRISSGDATTVKKLIKL